MTGVACDLLLVLEVNGESYLVKIIQWNLNKFNHISECVCYLSTTEDETNIIMIEICGINKISFTQDNGT